MTTIDEIWTYIDAKRTVHGVPKGEETLVTDAGWVYSYTDKLALVAHCTCSAAFVRKHKNRFVKSGWRFVGDRKTLLLAVVLSVCCSMAQAATYYVSPTGSDSNDGLSTSTPWHTISKVNSSGFLPGDSVLFEGGQSFPGNLLLTSLNGTTTSPITIGSYGTGVATLTSTTGNGIELDNCPYIVVENVTVSGPGWNLGTLTDDSRGVFLNRSTTQCQVISVTATRFHTAGFSLDSSTANNTLEKDYAVKEWAYRDLGPGQQTACY